MEVFNPAYIPRAFGLANIGNTCFLNSIIQALLGCSSFVKAVINNPVFREFLSKQDGYILYRYFRVEPGQQDAHEYLLKILDQLKLKLFNIKYKVTIHCRQCNYVLEKINPMENMIYYEGEGDLTEYIKMHKTYSPGYKCEKCSSVNSTNGTNIVQIYQLMKISEVIIICFKKYMFSSSLSLIDLLGQSNPISRSDSINRSNSIKKNYDFPRILRFNGINGELCYELVSQIEHYGNNFSGHYNVISIRKNNQGLGVYKLDDSSYSPAGFGSTPNTYLVFYHLKSQSA